MAPVARKIREKRIRGTDGGYGFGKEGRREEGNVLRLRRMADAPGKRWRGRQKTSGKTCIIKCGLTQPNKE